LKPAGISRSYGELQEPSSTNPVQGFLEGNALQSTLGERKKKATFQRYLRVI